MRSNSRKRTGFTLVELLMVAVILAILAVVVIPQFSDASSDVKTSSLRASLQTVRSQLELYRAQHGGSYPTKIAWVDAMTKKTNATGGVAADGKFGPYLQQVPVNPMDDSSTIAATQDGSGGWVYDENAGTFKANDSSIKETNSKTKDM